MPASKALSKGITLGGWDGKKYSILSVLNKGSYGTVYSARNSRNLQKVAIKQISKNTQTIELEILTRLRKASSRNVIKLIDSFSDDKSSYIVNDFCTLGDLYEVIAANRVPTETEIIRDLVLQLISSVEACHSVGVYHRDIKPENIFLTIEEGKATTNGDGEVILKLGDFGLATTDEFSQEIGTGSDRYMAPEQFTPDETGGYDTALSDIWSLGIVIVNTLFSRNPWKTPTENDPIFKDFLRDPTSLFEHFTDLTQDTYNVIKHALHIDPSERSLQKMKAAVAEVLEWSQSQEDVHPAQMSRRNSTNLADYDTTGPTAGRGPLRTPSLSQQAKFSTTTVKSFPWTSALASMTEESRNGLGFAKPARKHSSTLSSSWRKAPPQPSARDIGSLDSGLGTSLASLSFQKRAIPKISRPAMDVPFYAASAPAARIKFPEPSPNKGHLKFGMSWADDDFDSDSESLSEPVWSDDTSPKPKAEGQSTASSAANSLEDGDLFDFEESST